MPTPTILVVDDNADVRARLGQWLAEAGYQPVTAADGLEALKHLHSGPVDLILSDVLMPRMDGYQFCRAVKKEEVWARIPFVFFTSTFVDQLHRELGRTLGASAYLAVKPEKGDELIAAVEVLLDRHKRGDLIAVEAELKDEVAFQRAYHQALWHKLSGRLAQSPDLRDLMDRYGNQIEALQELGASLAASRETDQGRLVDRIARTLEHEINNPLAIILTLAQLAGEETADPELQKAFQGIEQMVFRINTVISHLRRLSDIRVIRSPLGEMVDLSSEPPPGATSKNNPEPSAG